jgi:hypothetical protein
MWRRRFDDVAVRNPRTDDESSSEDRSINAGTIHDVHDRILIAA